MGSQVMPLNLSASATKIKRLTLGCELMGQMMGWNSIQS
jgi:hypothetical protein